MMELVFSLLPSIFVNASYTVCICYTTVPGYAFTS